MSNDFWEGYVEVPEDELDPEVVSGPLTLRRMLGPTLKEFKNIGSEGVRVTGIQMKWVARLTGKVSRAVVEGTYILVNEFKKGYNE